jgi:hypothetical protein
LRRLRQALYLKLRDELPPEALTPGALADWDAWRGARDGGGRIRLGRKDPRFWPAVGLALDVLAAVGARVSEAAEVLGISTANLIELLQTDPKVWEQANYLRARFDQKPLRSSG